MPHELTDLWESFRKRPDEASFEAFYAGAAPLIYTICRRILRDEEDALDAFQSAFARLYRIATDEKAAQRPGFAAIDVVKHAAVREAMNLSQRRARRQKREVAVETYPPAADPNAVSPDEAAMRRETLAILDSLIQLLPERQRLPVLLHYRLGFSQAEIADALGKSRNAVSYRLNKGIHRLRNLMKKAGLDENALPPAIGISTASLLSPPSAIQAAALFQSIQAGQIVAAAAGSTAAGAANSILQSIMGAGAMKAKAAVIGVGLAAILSVGTIAIKSREVRRDPEGPVTQSIATVPAGEPTPDVNSSSPRAATNEGAKPIASVSDGPSDVDNSAALSDMQTGTTIEIAVRWEESKEPVAGAQLALLQGGRPDLILAEAATDAEGRVVISLDSSEMRRSILSIRHPAAAPQSRSLENSPPRIEIELKKGASVYGLVVLEGDGEPVTGAMVRVLETHENFETNDKGEFEIDGIGHLAIRLVAKKGNYRSALSDANLEPIALVPGERVGPIQLILTKAPSVFGMVTDSETGEPVEGVEIRIGYDTLEMSTGKRVSDSGTWYFLDYEDVTEKNGRFNIGSLPTGNISIQALAKGYISSAETRSLTIPTDLQVDFHLEKGGVLEAHVVNGQGQPILGATVSASAGEESVNAVTDEFGLALLEGVERKIDGSFSVTKEGYHRALGELVFKPTEMKSVAKVELKRLGATKFFGFVKSEAGEALSGIAIEFLPSPLRGNRATRLTKRAETDTDGRYELQAVTGDDPFNLLKASSSGWTDATQWALPGSSDGERQIDFTLSKGYPLQGKIVDELGTPLPSVEVRAVPNDQSNLASLFSNVYPVTKSDAQGEFEFSGLQRKEMTLLISGDPLQKSHQESVEAGGSVTVTIPMPRMRIVGVVLDEETGETVNNFRVRSRTIVNGQYVGQSDSFYNSEAGEFIIADLPADSACELIVESEGYSTTILRRVEVRPASDETRIKIELKKVAPYVRGILRDAATGASLADAELTYAILRNQEIQWERIKSSTLESYTTRTDAGGKFSFSHGGADGTLIIRLPGYARMAIWPEDRERFAQSDGSLDIPLHPAASIAGSQSYDPRVKKLSLLDPNDRQFFEFIQVNENGAFEIGELEAGSYQLAAPEGAVAEPQHGLAGLTRLLVPVKLAAGETKFVRLGERLGPYTLKGLALNENGPRVSIVAAIPEFRWTYAALETMPDEEGRFEIHGLQPGKYRLQAIGLEFVHEMYLNRFRRTTLHEQPLTIDGDTEIEIRLGGAMGSAR